MSKHFTDLTRRLLALRITPLLSYWLVHCSGLSDGKNWWKLRVSKRLVHTWNFITRSEAGNGLCMWTCYQLSQMKSYLLTIRLFTEACSHNQMKVIRLIRLTYICAWTSLMTHMCLNIVQRNKLFFRPFMKEIVLYY